ncbi:FecR family protein [Sunxiuqinia sp. A32]|uniref:FecR family protein n=1 Tax=Sunxiuqinia sp. A32 TaxID=3461496 RepID=UPI0040464693
MDSTDYYKILSGRASSEEKEEFYRYLGKNPQEEKEFLKLKNLWNLQKIESGINHEFDKKQLFDEFWKKANSGSTTKTKRLLHTWARYAAIIVIALVTGFLVSKLIDVKSGVSTKEFYSESASISNIVLEDGSKITLNANTRLIIHESKNTVEAELKGEGYFDIVHDEKREFVVKINGLQIRDLGTTFNISAYPDNSIFRATLLDGEIDVLSHAGKLIKKLNPNETFSYNQLDKTYSLEKLESEIVTGWKENKFVFINKSLTEICKEIERWYDVEINIEDKALAGEIYTSVIQRTTTVGQLMEMFAITSGINYRISENEKAIIYINK